MTTQGELPDVVERGTMTTEQTASSIGEHAAEQVSSYVESYRFEIDGGQSYAPNDHEKAMIEDAIFGFFADWAEAAFPKPPEDSHALKNGERGEPVSSLPSPSPTEREGE